MSIHTFNELSIYLTFGLGDETFAFDVANVKEVLDLADVTKVPMTPDFMRGVINIRGRVVPVIDMRIKFGLPADEDTVDTCIIVVEVQLDEETVVIGALADSVREVFEIYDDQIEPPPSIGMHLSTDFIRGMGQRDDEFIIILDANRILSGDELVHLTSESDIDRAEDEALTN